MNIQPSQPNSATVTVGAPGKRVRIFAVTANCDGGAAGGLAVLQFTIRGQNVQVVTPFGLAAAAACVVTFARGVSPTIVASDGDTPAVARLPEFDFDDSVNIAVSGSGNLTVSGITVWWDQVFDIAAKNRKLSTRPD